MIEAEPHFHVLSDLDNVMGLTVDSILWWSNTWVDLGALGVDALTKRHYREDFHAMWGVSKEEGSVRWEEFCENYMGEIVPDPGVQAVFNKLPSTIKTDVLTSRSRSTQQLTTRWVGRHYPRIGQVLHALTDWHNDPEAHLKTKAWSLKEYFQTGVVPVQPDVTIDDEPKHARSYRDFGIKHSILFGDHEWNVAARHEEGIIWLPTAQLLEEFILEAYDNKMRQAA